MSEHFTFRDDCEVWLQDIMDSNYEEALSRVTSLLTQTTVDENGCWVRAKSAPFLAPEAV